jgi:hypothetical protein
MTLSQTMVIFNPTIWSPRINFWLRNKLEAARCFDDYSDEVTGGGDTINIPSIADGFSATAIAATSGSVAGTNISDTKTALSVNTWVGNKLVVSDFQKAQVAKSYRLQEDYMQAQAYALAKSLDSAILRLAALYTITTCGNTATALLSTTIEKAMAILASRSVPLNECTFLMHPKTYYRRIFGTAKFYDASQYGKPTLPMGVIDYLYGVPVVVTQQITTITLAGDMPGNTVGGSTTGYRNLLAHKSAFAYAIGNIPGQSFINGVRLTEARHSNADGAALATSVTADLAYGVVRLNPSRVVKIIDKQ